MGNCHQACTSNEDENVSVVLNYSISYDGTDFVLPKEISFRRQSTYTKIQKAAKEFCVNTVSPIYVPLITRVIAYRQEKSFLDIYTLLTPAQRQAFMSETNKIDHDLMDSFYHTFMKKMQQPLALDPKINNVRIPHLIKEINLHYDDRQYLVNLGLKAIKLKQVALIIMCSGSSSRVGKDKFLVPLELEFEPSLNMLDLLFFRYNANTYKHQIPIIIACNQLNIHAIQIHVQKREFYGINPSYIKYIRMNELALLDFSGKYCFGENLKVLKRPAGTAICADQCSLGSTYQYLVNLGVKYVQFSGTENLFQQPCDLKMLGLLINEKSKCISKCTNSKFANEPLSRYYSCERNQESSIRNTSEMGPSQKVELLYPENFSAVRNKQHIEELPIAMNSLIFELKEMHKIMTDFNSNVFLAEHYHVIKKQESSYDPETKTFARKDCYSFEKDICDVISCVRNPLLYLVDRSKYVPIHTMNDNYSFKSAVMRFKQVLEKQVGKLLRGSSTGDEGQRNLLKSQTSVASVTSNSQRGL